MTFTASSDQILKTDALAQVRTPPTRKRELLEEWNIERPLWRIVCDETVFNMASGAAGTVAGSEGYGLNEIMKQSKSRVGVDSCHRADGMEGTTVVEQVWALQTGLYQLAGVSVDHPPTTSAAALPKWCSKILEQLTKTILKPIIKLRPNGKVNWRHYGKMMGVFERYKTFMTHDVERMFREEGWDKFTDEEWEKIMPWFGEDKLRARLSELLGRPLGGDEPTEKAADEVWERQLKHLEKMKSDALWLVAQEDAKIAALFFKGMAEGYTCFLDENGDYVGDRGRARIYSEFLVHRMKIEKFRRMMPVKSRRDLQRWIINDTGIRILNDPKWFDRFCDEICLAMKGVGRTPKAPIL